MKRIVLLFICVALWSINLSAQTGTSSKSPLIGAWKVVETQAGPVTQPNLYLFTARHFSRMNTIGEKPRAKFKDSDPAKTTAPEKISAYDTFGANTGTYEISGNTIVFKILLAKSPNRPDDKLQFTLTGNMLTITNPETKAVTKLTRVE